MMTLVPVIARPYDVPLPRRAAYEVYSAFVEVREYFRAQLGATFGLLAPRVLRQSMTWEMIKADYDPLESSGFNLWLDVMREARVHADGRAYYLVYLCPPAPRPMGMGGMVGMENIEPTASPRPGMACMSDQMAWLVAGKSLAQVKAQGWNPPTWADDRVSAIGALCHEVVHIASDLPHSDTNEWSITFYWWDGTKAPLLDYEKEALMETGFFG